MKQTSKQEQDLLIQYEPYLRKIVFELRSRGGLPGVNDMEDLMQEARLEFLLHLRKIGDAEDIMNCKYNIKGALCTYWRLMAQLRIPKNSYHEEIRKVQCISMDDETCRCLADPTDRLSDEVEVRDFIDSLSPDEQIIVTMKLDGRKGREIIPVLHLKGEPQMSRMLKRVRSKAHSYFFSERSCS